MPAERVAAIDVGGTSLKGAVAGCGPAGSSPEVVQRPAPVADGPQAVVGAVLGFVAELASPKPGVVGVGVAVPGIVDEAAGTAIEPPNLDWRDVPIGAAVQGRVGLPVTVCHDVRASARP